MKKLFVSLWPLFVLFVGLNLYSYASVLPIISLSAAKIIAYQFGYCMLSFILFGIRAMMIEGEFMKPIKPEEDDGLLYVLLAIEIVFCCICIPNILHQIIAIAIGIALIIAAQRYIKQFSFYGEKGITA